MADNLGDLLADACRKFAVQPALEEKYNTLSYSQLSTLSRKVASVLRGHGLMRDEPVLVPVANEARDVAAFIGVWLAGGVVVPVARHSPATVIEATRAVCGARFFATGSDELVRHSGHEAPHHRVMLADAAIIVFTSGSTGRPKGVVLSHKAFVRKLEAIDSKLGFSTETRALLVLQITFVFGIWVTLLGLLKGGRILLQPRFEALPVLEMLAKQHITDAAFVPTMLRKFLSLDRAIYEQLTACTKLDRILSGGEPLGPALSRQIRDFFPKTGLADIYGLTETCSSDFFLMPEEQDRFSGAIGRCSPGGEIPDSRRCRQRATGRGSRRTADQNAFHHERLPRRARSHLRRFCRRFLPHRRSRAYARRRNSGTDRPSEGTDYARRREDLAARTRLPCWRSIQQWQRR